MMEQSAHTTRSALVLQCNPRNLTFLSHRKQAEETLRNVPTAEAGLFPGLQTEWKTSLSFRNSLPVEVAWGLGCWQRMNRLCADLQAQSRKTQSYKSGFSHRLAVSIGRAGSTRFPLSRCQLSSAFQRCGSAAVCVSGPGGLTFWTSSSITGDVANTQSHRLWFLRSWSLQKIIMKPVDQVVFEELTFC